MKASIKPVLLKHKKLKNGKYPVFARVIIERKIKYYSFGSNFSCYEKEWSQKDNCFKSGIKNFNIMNSHIDEIILKLTDTAFKLGHTNPFYTLEDFKLAYERKGNSILTLSYFDEIVNRMEKNGEIGNAEVYKQTKNRLKAFLLTKKITGDINLTSIDIKFLNEWVKFLRKTCGDVTIHLRLRTLRALTYNAIKEEGFELNVFKNYSLSFLNTKTPKRALKVEDLKLIFNYKAKKDDRKYHSLNYFKFMFLCRGMNFTDICLLKKEQIKATEFEYIRAKTHTNYKITLHEITKLIIEEYKDLTLDSPYVFPLLLKEYDNPRTIRNRIASQLKKVNSDIKEIAKELKIEFNVTTYTTRHTFATLLKYLGVQTEIIKELLGHANYKTTEVYLDNFDYQTLSDSTQLAINSIFEKLSMEN